MTVRQEFDREEGANSISQPRGPRFFNEISAVPNPVAVPLPGTCGKLYFRRSLAVTTTIPL